MNKSEKRAIREAKALEAERKEIGRQYGRTRHDEYALHCWLFGGPLSEWSDDRLAAEWEKVSAWEDSAHYAQAIYAEQLRRS